MSHPTESPRKPRLWRRTALAAVLMAGTALGGFAVGHSGACAQEGSRCSGRDSTCWCRGACGQHCARRWGACHRSCQGRC